MKKEHIQFKPEIIIYKQKYCQKTVFYKKITTIYNFFRIQSDIRNIT
jgi:hypothetical protein